MNEETRLNVNYDQDEESIINKVRILGFSKNIKFYSKNYKSRRISIT